MSELHVMYTLKLKKELGIDTSRIFYYRNNRKPPEEVNYAPRNSWSVIEGQKITAPGLVADQSYLNLMDWGMRNVIAVGLRERVCFYDTEAGKKSVGFNYGDELVSSVSWCPEGLDALAIGLKNSLVHLLDPNTNQAIRTFDSWGVGSLAWNGRILTTGSRDGHIVNYDVRVGTQVARLRKSHRRAICGLKWSASGQLLASGGSDNVVHVWDARSMPTRWLHKLEDHNAAVRAVAWCPLKRHLLASGGGQGDHYIRLWDASSGTPHENAVDTGSEVCGLLWSKHYQDILFSSHGFGVSESVPDNRLILWRSPVLFKLDEIDLQYDHPPALDLRPKPYFFSTQSPDGCEVALAGNDQIVRFYDVFAAPPPPEPAAKPAFSTYNRPNHYTIR
ncbi:cell division cycle 20.5, cofactor of APC complex-like [Rosa rugosa]|uniref:cell division cycle 20.5, cofactor of APC complex-like n=1 Tax=Rosa rugosa TaxID=74645 RepID=UPI002B40BDE7|nr:cell division cycle 20.5, cofactor of APC complex-like [Rosa rugosa]